MKSNNDPEKRHDFRHICLATTKWSYFGKSFANEGRILNFSNQGIYLETKVPPKPGTTVWYRVEKRFSGMAGSETSDFLPSIGILDTKWCKALSKDSGQGYGVGLKYQDPIS